jgi:hypothetical protein
MVGEEGGAARLALDSHPVPLPSGHPTLWGEEGPRFWLRLARLEYLPPSAPTPFLMLLALPPIQTPAADPPRPPGG